MLFRKKILLCADHFSNFADTQLVLYILNEQAMPGCNFKIHKSQIPSTSQIPSKQFILLGFFSAQFSVERV